ncbi:FliH/SctL family protein [Desulfovibrio sp. SGI.169]|uniref:FliH/SctL family protein n=1 Tax=Desulfovibrio sp. SGI.169 TaxID=3420561 RepID=UPI003D0940D9
MASEELRKKWGTIFMGEREATVEQLDAMQEPMRREQLKRERQEDYLERVRARAAERAREILGAAYAERQKVLEEARAEIKAERQKLISESDALKAAGTAAHEQAAAALAKAEAAREEAGRIREAAHGEGFQAGMEQAGAELREFRAELGQSLAAVLRAVDAQRKTISDSWREELVELVQTAVAAGTGWLLGKEHNAVLRSLVLEAVSLLEDRATVTVRVNPEDEAAVGDMFMAARERVPELKQWIVNGDASVERGGLVAESVSGSVDCRREHFRELVDGVLVHLALPVSESEEASSSAVHELVEREVERIAALSPVPEPPATSASDLAPEAAPEIAPDVLEPESLTDGGAVAAPGEESDMPLNAADAPLSNLADAPPQAAPPLAESAGAEEASLSDSAGVTSQASASAAEASAPHAAPLARAETLAPSVSPVERDIQNGAVPAESLAAENSAEKDSQNEAMPQAWLPPLGDDEPDAGAAPAVAREPASGADGYEGTAAAVLDAPRKENPSLAELEEELFPLEHENQREVLAGGGFLPGAGNS